MGNWLKIFLPRKYAVIDGRRVTEPIINGSDTTFTVTGDSNWGSTSKYNVHLQGPNSYYLYKTLSEPKDDPSAGGARQDQITVTGNEPERLNRYRGYLNSLAPEDYKYWWQQIFSKACGGKVEKAENGIKTPTALSGRNYWEGFKARNEALWDKVKNNTFVNMIAPVKDLSEGNTEAILPWIATKGMSQLIVGLSKAAPVKAGSKEFKTIINQNPQIPKWNNPERLTYRQGADKVEFGPTGDDFTVIPKIRKKIANQLTKDLHSGKYNSEGLERIVAGPDGLYGIKPQNKEPIFVVNGKEDWVRNFLERLKIKKLTGGQLSFKNGGKISDLLNNQEFLVNLEKCGGKMKKKACGGKMKKKK